MGARNAARCSSCPEQPLRYPSTVAGRIPVALISQPQTALPGITNGNGQYTRGYRLLCAYLYNWTKLGDHRQIAFSLQVSAARRLRPARDRKGVTALAPADPGLHRAQRVCTGPPGIGRPNSTSTAPQDPALDRSGRPRASWQAGAHTGSSTVLTSPECRVRSLRSQSY